MKNLKNLLFVSLVAMSLTAHATGDINVAQDDEGIMHWIGEKIHSWCFGATAKPEVIIPEVIVQPKVTIPEVKEVPAQGFFSKIGSGITSGYNYSKDTIVEHPYWTAFVVAGITTAVVATYVLSAEESETADEF